MSLDAICLLAECVHVVHDNILRMHNDIVIHNVVLLLRPGRGAMYCDQPVCMCVCLSVRQHISGTAGPIGTKFLFADPLWPWLGPPPAVLRYFMYFRFYG